MNHYFDAQPQSPSRPQAFALTYRGAAFTFTSDAGVFSKGDLDAGTRLLLDALPWPLSGRLYDLGCGWGAVGVIAGKLSPGLAVTMSDLNERAVSLAAMNARANGVAACAMAADGARGVDGRFDVITLNPPIRAGKDTVYRLFREARERLAPRGARYVVMRVKQGAPSALKYLATIFQSVETVRRSGGYHVFCCKEARDAI